MSVEPNLGPQLPKQRKIQIQTGARTRNMGGGSVYMTKHSGQGQSSRPIPKGKKSESVNPNLSFIGLYGNQEVYNNIRTGQVSVLNQNSALVSEGFDVTRRNLENPFFSSPTSVSKFNNQRLNKLQNHSRFRKVSGNELKLHNAQDILSGDMMILDTQEMLDISNRKRLRESALSMYDIKGNSYKQTLFPKQTADRQLQKWKNGSMANLSLMETSACDITGDQSMDVTNDNESQKILFHDMDSPDSGSPKEGKLPKMTYNSATSRSLMESKLKRKIAQHHVENDYESSFQKIVPHRDTFQGYKRSGQMLFNNVVSNDHHNVPIFNINQTMGSPYTKKIIPQQYSSTPKARKNISFQEKGLTDTKLLENQSVRHHSSFTIKKNINFNNTIMEIPSMPKFGNDMDQTVKFNTRDKQFIKGQFKIDSTKYNTKQVSPYQQWAGMSEEKNNDKEQNLPNIQKYSSGNRLISPTQETPIKCSSELQKTMSLISKHSVKFNKKQLNNYNNQVKNNQDKLYEKLNLKATNSTLYNGTGSTYLQSSQMRQDENGSPMKLSGFNNSNFSSKSEFKKIVNDKLNKWSYFDSNMNHALVEQRKILQRKNYELDSRANALKDFGYQPHFQQDLNLRRTIEEITQGNRTVGNAHENLAPFMKNYTQITKFQKSLIDSKMGSFSTGPKITSIRPNLNIS